MSGISFLYEGVRFLARGIGPIFLRIMVVGALRGGYLDSGGAWVMRECLGRRGLGLRVAELGSYLLSFPRLINWSRGPPYSGHSCP